MASIINATTTNGLAVTPDNSGELRLQTNNGTTAVTIATSQNVGIGTSTITSSAGWSPRLVLAGTDTALVVKGSSGQENTFGTSGGLYIDCLGHSTGTSNNIIFRNTSTNSSYSATERMRITSGGYSKFSNSGTYLDLSSTGSYHEFYNTTNNTDALVLSHAGASGTQYGLYIKTANDQNDTARYFLYCQGGSTQRASFYSNGGLYNYSANNSNLSDRREKTDFEPAKSYLSTICSIPVQTFKYIDQTDDDKTLGVVAQDVQAVAPELVTESNWGTEDEPKMRLSIYQTDLQYALMKCIQELKTELDTVKAELQALKGTE